LPITYGRLYGEIAAILAILAMLNRLYFDHFNTVVLSHDVPQLSLFFE
jgi:hypothetical protein